MTEILKIIAIVAYSLAGAFLAAAIVLWFTLKIRTVIGELTGRAAPKPLPQQSAHRAATAFSSTTGMYPTAATAPSLTGTGYSGDATDMSGPVGEGAERTEFLGEEEDERADETTAELDGFEAEDDVAEPTEVLSSETTEILGETDALMPGEAEEIIDVDYVPVYPDFHMLESTIIIHTEEVI